MGRIQCERFGDGLVRLLDLTGPHVDARQCDLRVDVVGLELHGLQIAAVGALDLALVLGDLAGDEKGLCILRVDLKHVADFDIGLVVVGEPDELRALFEPRLNAARLAAASGEQHDRGAHRDGPS